jgi:hypothetical protein
MEIICIEGLPPGPVTTTVSHGGRVQQISMEVGRHPAGGWRARLAGRQEWGPRCHAVSTAVLLEASEQFVEAEPLLMAAD